jgi:hypothetical protein
MAASFSGEHRLPACICRQLADNIFKLAAPLKPSVLASCQDEQAGSLLPPEN